MKAVLLNVQLPSKQVRYFSPWDSGNSDSSMGVGGVDIEYLDPDPKP